MKATVDSTLSPRPPREAGGVYGSSFAELAARLSRREPAWLHELRKEAFARFTTLGFPTSRDEEWRFTNVEAIARGNHAPASPGRLDGAAASLAAILPRTSGPRLVFVNGRFAAELSSLKGLPDGIEVQPLAQAIAAGPDAIRPHLSRHPALAGRAFAALNGAFLEDGAFVRIRKGAVVPEPVHIVFIAAASGQPTASFPRVLILAGERSEARVVESYLSFGEGPTLTNAVTEVTAEAEAVLEHVKIEEESLEAAHVGLLAVHLGRACNFASRSVTLGGGFVRNDIDAVLDGEGIDCHLDGLYAAAGRQMVDNHTRIEHAQPHCGSREVYKGILGGAARSIFNGKIHVRQAAQKTDAKQSNKNLILSPDAIADTRPQLEIYADDVKCTHGATIGYLDDDAMFYLRTRGLAEDDARDLLTYAFASEVIGRIGVEEVRTRIEHKLFAALDRPAAAGLAGEAAPHDLGERAGFTFTEAARAGRR
jgi:Fe-S cluster assembly protein SufD